ncbi:MAG: ABC transporter substrate-binding protein [Nostoc sp.]|uniref:ABC transporter substrate-binding protein n=1 Tax=unclassified Nostoc TaxID=2593658 RepID=UPI0025F7E022|nr:ABC transporter substrate-binding protein [Nostoc sp. NMS7]
MTYCINPDCSQRENPDNCAVCENCTTPLILQNRYRIKHPLQINKYSCKVAQKLVKYPDLLAVLGHYSSEATKQALSIYTKAGVVLVSATSTSDNLKSPFFFRTVPSDRMASHKRY